MTRFIPKTDDEYLGDLIMNVYEGMALPERLRNNAEFMREAIYAHPILYKEASKDVREDIEIASLALRNGEMLEYAPQSIKENKDLVLQAVSNYPLAMKYADEYLKRDLEIARVAISNNGFSICCFSEEIKNNLEMALLATKNNNLAYKFLGEGMQKNKKVVEQCFEFFMSPKSQKSFGERDWFQKGCEVCEQILQQMLKENLSQFTNYIEQKQDRFRYLPKSIRDNKYVVEAARQFIEQSSKDPLLLTKDWVVDGMKAIKEIDMHRELMSRLDEVVPMKDIKDKSIKITSKSIRM